MNEQVSEYLDKFPCEVVGLFKTIRGILLDAVPTRPEECLWAKLPSYYVGASFVRLIVFKDHINIEAKASTEYKDELMGYKMTPKGMLQVYINQAVPADVLRRMFAETLAQ